MRTIEWLGRLDSARSSQEVLAVLGEYVASWSSYDRAQLPESCRIPAVPKREDVARLALAIPNELERFDLDKTRARLLKMLEIFIARALVRVSQIASEQAVPFIPPVELPPHSLLPVGPHSELPRRQ